MSIAMTMLRWYIKQFKILTLDRWVHILIGMNDGAAEKVYQAFGKLVRLHRERLDGMTQEKLGKIVGLSRTSITNIEKGRQHVSLHYIIAIAEALKVRPHVLLPSGVEAAPESRVAKRLPPGTEREIAEWAEKVVGD